MRLLLLLVAALFGACSDDGPAPEAVPASSSSVAASCDECRTVAAGNAFQDGDTAVGVSRCDATSCEVSIAAPDGTETELDLAPGDALDVGAGWTVVDTGAAGLTLRPA